jgi:hypothetical protein
MRETLHWLRKDIPPILVFFFVSVGVTLLSYSFSEPSERIGELRALSSIPIKVVELAVAGLGIGVIASLAERRRDGELTLLGIAFVTMMDLDHLPAVFGVGQPIRPAHGLLFLGLVVVGLSFTVKQRPWIEAVAVSAFFFHLGLDTGIFSPFAPFSFAYYEIGNRLRLGLLGLGVLFALVAGYSRMRSRTKSASGSIQTKP